METLTVQTSAEHKGQRLDKVLAQLAPALSRARVQALMAEGRVRAGDKPEADASRKLRETETFIIEIPPPEEAEPRPQDIALDIVYEDEHLLVLNKPAGMVVHPAAGNHDGTLVNALLAHCGNSLSGIGGVKRPGIVHRLDKQTSGLMAVAKSDAAHRGLSEQLSSRTLKRVYRAVVWGLPSPPEGRIETGIGRSKTNRQKMTVLTGGGKEAITDYTAVENFGLLASLVECRLQTGRTHQIRVHMAHVRHWVVGDPVYGHPSARKTLNLRKAGERTAKALLSFPRQALHAAEIGFIHPVTGKAVRLSVGLPADMKALVRTLKTA